MAGKTERYDDTWSKSWTDKEGNLNTLSGSRSSDTGQHSHTVTRDVGPCAREVVYHRNEKGEVIVKKSSGK